MRISPYLKKITSFIKFTVIKLCICITTIIPKDKENCKGRIFFLDVKIFHGSRWLLVQLNILVWHRLFLWWYINIIEPRDGKGRSTGKDHVKHLVTIRRCSSKQSSRPFPQMMHKVEFFCRAKASFGWIIYLLPQGDNDIFQIRPEEYCHHRTNRVTGESSWTPLDQRITKIGQGHEALFCLGLF